MRLFFIFLIIIGLSSCTRPTERIKLRITFECTPTIYFDSLTNVLLSNSYRDLDGKSASNSSDIIVAQRVYAKNLKKKSGNAFILDNVEKAQYGYLLVEAYLSGVLYTGFIRGLDFRKISTDTADVTICVEPNERVIPN
jgi:hypothetical protein